MILLIVAIGEIGYYFFVRSSNTKVVTLTQGVLPQPTSGNSNKLVDPRYIDYLSRLDKNDSTKYYLTFEIKGTVSNISVKEFTDKGHIYKASLSLVDDNNTLVQGFNFTDKQLAQIRFYLINKDQKSPLNITDIKKGMRLQYTSVADLTKDIKSDIISSEFDVYK
jgi:hypothetical protein